MNITFPNFGPVDMVLPKIFGELGISCTVPEPNDNKTLAIGIKASPDEICIPFKYMAGNLVRAYERGADTVLMAATSGPCRLGEYCELLRISLKNKGCNYRWIVLGTPDTAGLRSLLDGITSSFGGEHIKTRTAIISAAKGLRLVFALDRLRRRLDAGAAFLDKPYEAIRVVKEAESHVRAACGFRESFQIVKNAEKKLSRLKRKSHIRPVRILLVGEIYTSMETEANGRLEEKLIMMGCSIRRHIDMTWWIRHTLGNIIIPERMRTGGKKGSFCEIGGYGRATVKEVQRGRKADGIIKIMPSGCMPEIVSKAYCEMLQKETGCSILHLIYDEMSSSTGYETRLEAFTDMLERRRDVLAGNRHRLHKHRFCNDR